MTVCAADSLRHDNVISASPDRHISVTYFRRWPSIPPRCSSIRRLCYSTLRCP